MPDRIHELLDFWFGHLGTADLPNSERTGLWFGANDVAKQALLQAFEGDFLKAKEGYLNDWAETPRGRLALILLYDQFPRYLYKNSAQAFALDAKARALCLEGMKQKSDQSLTLIERAFFYMPLVHAEDSEAQELSISLYRDLLTLAMIESREIYHLFSAYAYAHFCVIKEFGRFPQRNAVLGRESTEAELAFLKNT